MACESDPRRLFFSQPPEEDPFDCIAMIRSAYRIRDEFSHILKQGPMSPLASNYLLSETREGNKSRAPSVASCLTSTTEQQLLARLTSTVQNMTTNSDLSVVYCRTLGLLSTVYSRRADPTCEANMKALWINALAEIPEQFFVQLRQSEPGALIIFAHYCIPLKELDNDTYWYMRSWSRLLFDECVARLDRKWLSFLDWPLAVLKADRTSHPSQ